jgi:DNA-3-methyladenine glycosylase I
MKNSKRCPWVPADNALCQNYHDEEWGKPVHDDRIHFEFLILEAAQAGLNWLTILKKREGYRKAFKNFDPAKVAQFDEEDVHRLLQNQDIIRNRLKIAAAVNNAQMFLKIQKEFGSFDNYIWHFVDNKPVVNTWKTLAEIPSTSPVAIAVSKDLKKRGFKFVGPTIIYAHLQATGLVNDHLIDCPWR